MARAPGRLLLALPDIIRSILATVGRSLAEISRASRSIVSGSRLHHIPHNFYSALRKQRFSPSLYQMHALSVLSGYRLVDWLRLFGFSLDEVPRWHTIFPALRTVELDPRVYRSGASIPWFYDLQEADLSAPLLPLSRWLSPDSPRRLDSISQAAGAAFRYVKIGSQDAFAFPDLVPGSIVRVNHDVTAFQQMPIRQVPAKNVFLVKHSGGLTCSRLYRSESKNIVLCSRHLPYAPTELVLGTEAVLLGVADLEIRPLRHVAKPVVPARLGRYWIPTALPPAARAGHVGDFIRSARKQSGLSFRQASERTWLIARKLADSRYYCAAGALSDYETRRLPPRHIHKLISICAVYFASAAELLEVAGASLEDAGKLPIPLRFLERPPRAAGSSAVKSSRFLKTMERLFGPLPYFLLSAVPSFFSLPELSVRDVFWAGGFRGSLHRHLASALFLIVDRRQKRPRSSLSSPAWAQPLYVLQQRDGSYLCGSCGLQDGTLILGPCIADMPKLLRLRNRVDAEVVGRVTGIVRRLM
jgi:hypothetical protein